MPRAMYPVEAMKDRYVAPFGGFSSELAGGEIGLRREALERNTRLDAGADKVLVTTDAGGRATPLFAKPFFRVVGLDEERPEALASSPMGEVVFSEEDYGGSTYAVFDTLRAGAMIVMNATLATRTPTLDLNVAGVFARARFRAGGE